ncbi:MAG: GYF domain-containing protein [Gemmataceae bacterium]
MAKYYVGTGEKVFGPFSLEQLTHLRDRGQLMPGHEVSEDQQSWMPATSIPGLFPPDAVGSPPRKPTSAEPKQWEVVEEYPRTGMPVAPNEWMVEGRYTRPHRGGLILALGVISLVVCAPLGIAAWVMGSKDLKRMRTGEIDPSGQGITQAGQICGIIASVFMLIGCLIYGTIFTIAIGGAMQGR